MCQGGRGNKRFRQTHYQLRICFPKVVPSATPFNTALIMLFVCILLAFRPAMAISRDDMAPRLATNKIVSRFLARGSGSMAQEYRAEMGIDLVNCGILSDDSMETWEVTTSAFISGQLLLREYDLHALNVTSKILKQQLLVRRLSPERKRARREQVDYPLRLLFDVSVSFQSNSANRIVEQWIQDAFSIEGQRSVYIIALKVTKDESFDNVEDVTVYSRELLGVRGERDGQQENNNTMIVIAGVLGGVSCVTLVGLLCYLRSTSKNEEEDIDQPQGEMPVETTENVTDDRIVAIVDTSDPIDEDGISTLGGSIMSAGFDKMASLDGMQQEEALQYPVYNSDKAKEVNGDRTREGSTQQGSLSIGRNSFGSESLHISKQPSTVSDDVSFERQYSGSNENNTFEVAAPAGKLGVIIDTPESSPPTVFAIKDTSPLAGVVTVGDQLVSVDGTNTTEMSSVEVSQLLFDRAENATRILVFYRTVQY